MFGVGSVSTEDFLDNDSSRVDVCTGRLTLQLAQSTSIQRPKSWTEFLRSSPVQLWNHTQPHSLTERCSYTWSRHIAYSGKGPSIKYVTLFLANFDPLPLSYFVTHPGTPESTSHISDPPIFSRPSTKIPVKSPLFKFYINCSQRFLSGGFCPGSFLSVPPSVTIHLLQLTES